MLTMQREMTRPFLILLTLPATAMGFALSVQISVLSWILSTRYGLHIHEIGLVWAAGPLAGILGQVVVGLISDQVWLWNGRRRPFILVGGVLSALMILALPRIGAISHALGFESVLGVAIAVALALDLSINVSFNPTRSIIADVTREGAMRTRGYTWMQTVSGLFGVLSYGIGAILGNDVLISVAAVLVLAFSVIPSLLVTEPRELRVSAASPAAAGIGIRRLAHALFPLWGLLAYDVIAMGLRIAGVESHGYGLEYACLAATAALFAITLRARDRGVAYVREDLVEFRKVLAAHSLSWIGVQTMFVYMIAFVQQRFPALGADGTGRVLSISFLVLNATGALMPALALDPLARRFGSVNVHAASVLTMGAGFLAVYLAAWSPMMLYVIMAIMGIGWASIVSLPFAILSERVDSARTGLYMGLFNLSIVLPQLLVSLGVGTLISRVGDKSMIFLIGAITLALSGAAWLLLRRTVPAPSDVRHEFATH